MSKFALRGRGRRLTMLAAAALIAAGLAACSSDEDTVEGTPFTQALAKNYADLSTQAAALPAAAEEGGFLDSLNPFSSSDTSSDLLAKAFTAKADLANAGTEPEPEAGTGPAQTTIRGRLTRAVAANKDQFPEQAARAQADFDCWALYSTVASASAAAQACKTALDTSLPRLETASRAATPAPVPVPAPAPVSTAPVPPPAPAQAANNAFTVYFDFDSWTLKAEQLKVLDDVISTARSGGQSNIVIVGHTDTSGSAEYNQALSVKRANVVVEALVQMGARRSALHASGVGETDLAVQTGDGVKEAKNRRTVVTLQP